VNANTLDNSKIYCPQSGHLYLYHNNIWLYDKNVTVNSGINYAFMKLKNNNILEMTRRNFDHYYRNNTVRELREIDAKQRELNELKGNNGTRQRELNELRGH
jgi:hypothetical protein